MLGSYYGVALEVLTRTNHSVARSLVNLVEGVDIDGPSAASHSSYLIRDAGMSGSAYGA